MAGLQDGGLITPCSARNKSRSESKSQPYPKESGGGASRARDGGRPTKAPMAAAPWEMGASPSWEMMESRNNFRQAVMWARSRKRSFI